MPVSGGTGGRGGGGDGGTDGGPVGGDVNTGGVTGALTPPRCGTPRRGRGRGRPRHRSPRAGRRRRRRRRRRRKWWRRWRWRCVGRARHLDIDSAAVRSGVAQQPARVDGGDHVEVAADPGLVADRGGGGPEDAVGHRPLRQGDDPEEEREHPPAVEEDHRHDVRGDGEDETEEHGCTVQPSRGYREIDRIGHVRVEAERRVLVGHEVHVGQDPGVPAHVPGQEPGEGRRQPSGEQRGEPSEEHDDERAVSDHTDHDELGQGQDQAEEHGDPALGSGRPEPDLHRGRGIRRPARLWHGHCAPSSRPGHARARVTRHSSNGRPAAKGPSRRCRRCRRCRRGRRGRRGRRYCRHRRRQRHGRRPGTRSPARPQPDAQTGCGRLREISGRPRG